MTRLHSSLAQFISQRAKVCIPHICIGDTNIIPSDSLWNLGIIFDSQLSVDHSTNIAKYVCLSLHNIGHIWKHLNCNIAELVSSKLANSLVSSISNTQVSHLQ